MYSKGTVTPVGIIQQRLKHPHQRVNHFLDRADPVSHVINNHYELRPNDVPFKA